MVHRECTGSRTVTCSKMRSAKKNQGHSERTLECGVHQAASSAAGRSFNLASCASSASARACWIVRSWRSSETLPCARSSASSSWRPVSAASRQLEDRCSEVLNLVPAFHDRFIQDDADWSASLYPRLQTFLTEAARSHEHLRLALDAHTTLAFAAGAVLDVKSGRDIELEQRTSSREVWRLDTQTPDAEWPRFNPVLVELGQQAPDIAVAVGLTHDIRADVRTYVDSNLPSAGRILNCMLPSGAGPASVRNGAHAALLAHQLAQAVSETRVPGVARTVHLFMAAPNGFSFLAGQRRALMGRVTLYEFDFGQAQSGSYMPSLTLPLAAAPSAAIALTPR